MERYKKIGKSSFAKHLRKKKGKWTKSMANSKSRLRSADDLEKEIKHSVTEATVEFKILCKRLKEAIKVKGKSKYQYMNFDKLVDNL